MKNRLLSLSAAALLLATSSISAAETSATLIDAIRATTVFEEPLQQCGGTASDAENQDLLMALGRVQTDYSKSGLAALERFLDQYPQSTWGASLRVNLAEHYRGNGRYSLALHHWETAWKQSKSSTEPQNQMLAVRGFAGWSRLLASLGQRDRLTALFAELDASGLPLRYYSSKIQGTREGLFVMNSSPSRAYRCGSLALGHVAEVLKRSQATLSNIWHTPSPAEGFKVSEIIALAKSNGVAIEPLKRPQGAEIIVPSIVHWKLNHYAAIVARSGQRFKVVDPTFEREMWMEMATIEAETSGIFLVPTELAPAAWPRLDERECMVAYGKGAPVAMADEEDPGRCPCPPNPPKCEEDEDEPADPPAANEGPGDGEPEEDCPPPDAGMPQWNVSEPYTTLWITDTPVFYRRSDGQWATFQLRYKHKGNYKGASIGSFGPMWECNLIGYLKENTTANTFDNHKMGGGQKWSITTNSLPDFRTGRTFAIREIAIGGASGGSGSASVASVEAPAMVSKTGSRTHYQFSSPAGVGYRNHFPTHRVDRYGRTTFLNYESVGSMVRVTNVVDRDGKSFSIGYTNTVYPNLITSVSDPYQRTAYFKYDALGRLTNIVDMAGMGSSFEYDSDDRITNMITLYGTNSFEYLAVTNSGSLFHRAIRIAEPLGTKQLYAYVADGLDGHAASYHWNRRQYQHISSAGLANLLDMPYSDYTLATLKNFIVELRANGYTTTDTPFSKTSPVRANGERTSENYAFASNVKRPTGVWTSMGQLWSAEYNEAGNVTNTTYYRYSGSSSDWAASFTNIYDSTGRILKEVWGPRGERVRGYGYHPVITNLLVAVTNAENEVVRYTHNTNGMKVTSITFPSGLVRTNHYIASGTYAGFLSSTIEIGFRTNAFGYDKGNIVAETNELGLVKLHLYDNLNRLISTTFPDNTTVSNVYDKLDLVAVKDRMNRWSYFGYNRLRQMVAQTNTAGQVTTYDYCGCGSPSEVTRWNGLTGLTTQYSYEMNGLLTNVVFPDGYTLSYTYDAADLVEIVADSAGHEIEFYNVRNGSKPFLARVRLDGQTLYHSKLDEYGRVAETIDRRGITTTNAYDFLNRLLVRHSFMPGGSEATGMELFSYSTNGLAAYTNALSKITRYVRDVAGRLLYETNANNEVLSFTYNAADQLLLLKDGKNNTTRWNYDQYGRVTNKLDTAMSPLFVYKYDPLDQLTNRWSAGKGDTRYYYDLAGNLTNVVYASGTTPNIVLRYDGFNRLTNMVDAAGSTAFEWTAGDQLLSEDGPWTNDKIAYSFLGRMRAAMNIEQAHGSPWWQTYTYTDMGRMHSISSPAGVFDYTYYVDSDRVQQIDLPVHLNGIRAYIYNEYDEHARLKTTRIGRPLHGAILNGHAYSYNVGNQRTQQVFTAGNFIDYTYDNIGQLQSAKGQEADGTTLRPHEQFGYAYDKAWNLQYRTNNALVQTFSVDNLNQLNGLTRSGTFTVAGTVGEIAVESEPVSVTVSGTGLSSGSATVFEDGTWARAGATLANGNNTYTATATDSTSPTARTSQDSVTVNLPSANTFLYDLNGNLRTNNTRIFDYDDENQLIRITEPNAWKSEFTYDGFMRRRVRKEFTWSSSAWVLTNEVRYVYDGRLVIQERDTNSIPQVSYTRGPDLRGAREGAGGIGGLLARTDNSKLQTQNPEYSHAYYHCDGNGNVSALVNTNGQIVASYNYDPSGNVLSIAGPLAEANVYRFSSKEQHRSSGMISYLYRFYDANLQRWINRDPISEAGGINLFNFVRNDSINFVDAYGECPLGSPYAADSWAGGTPPISSKEALKETGKGLALGAGIVASGATFGAALEYAPLVMAAGGLLSSPQAQARIQPMLAAINQNGKVILNPNLALSHKAFAERALGITGQLPPGTWVGTVGTVNNQIVALNSATFYGNQALANPAVQDAVKEACKALK